MQGILETVRKALSSFLAAPPTLPQLPGSKPSAELLIFEKIFFFFTFKFLFFYVSVLHINLDIESAGDLGHIRPLCIAK